jgi:type VI secretion system secreted protein VgrG
MADKTLLYWIDLGGHRLPCREVKGSEAVFKPFRFEVRFAVEDGAALDPDALVRSDAALLLQRGAQQERRIDGVVTSIEVGAKRGRAPEVVVVLEPRLALARYRQDIRIFRQKTAPEIVVEVLSGLGIKTELRLQGEYERREYCVQLREADLDFTHRMLEDEGIFYFIGDGDVVVLGDSPAAYEPGGPALPVRPGLGLDQQEDAIYAVGARSSMGPSKMTLRDFNPEHPSLDMTVSAGTPCPGGPEYYDYPGEYLEPGAGSRKVKLRAESVACATAAVTARSFCARLFPGNVLQMTGAPAPMEDGGYVVTRIEHDFDRSRSGFSNDLTLLREDVAFRPRVVTHIPVLMNPMTGFVTGPPGEDIYTDRWGRVKVHFHWDRRQPFDDTCSYWIPTLQDNTGHSVGIPRIGWEVLVHFLEGDPDRPVVLGRVYNAEDAFPQRLPDMKTRTSLKSMTSPRSKEDITGTNEIQFEDLAGEERFYMHAERDQIINVANNKTEVVTNNETRVVKRDEMITISGNNTVKAQGDMLPAVQGDQKFSVGGDREVTIDSADDSNVKGKRKRTISGEHKRKIGTNDRVEVKKDLEEEITGSVMETSEMNNRLQIGKESELKVGGSFFEKAKEGKMESASKRRDEKIGGSVDVTADDIISSRVDQKRTTTVTGEVSIDSTKEMVIIGKKKLETKSDIGVLAGGTKLTLRVGDSEIAMKDGTIAMKAKDEIRIDADGENNLGAGVSTQI